jgi:hypothetical protein
MNMSLCQHPVGEHHCVGVEDLLLQFLCPERLDDHNQRRAAFRYVIGDAVHALIPSFHGHGRATLYAPTRFREIKRKVQRLVNSDQGKRKLEFHIKTFRDTYCQMCIDLDASKLSAISKTMGNATTRTT